MEKQAVEVPEIWGGIECTINRVQDNYFDQLRLSGFYQNKSYLVSIVSLGIKLMRFPILWERHQPSLGIMIDWTWTEEQLEKLRSNNITPIAGLLHHGSGPAFTNLLREDFPELFAAYAGKVAAKFPWIQYYTPVNEPLTTARFSGLYGFWYPHKKNDTSFIKMLLNELKASILAMREIRKINPDAKFIQTEDLGKTYSTPLLSYQAEFENCRRWLTYDFLCGNVSRNHPLWKYLTGLGISAKSLQFFIDNSFPPDIVGVNHYLTSERYLDENILHYPKESIGGNGMHKYADIAASRVQLTQPHGLEHLLQEIWQRYKIPIAITEAHLNCSREDQIRWLNEVYNTACKLKSEKVNIIAVTAWALLGSFGWNKLLTGEPFDYETGAFDISAGYARPTALALLIKSLNAKKSFGKHLLEQSGWWKLNSRYYKKTRQIEDIKNQSEHPLIIIGKTGTLGKAFSRVCSQRNIPHFLVDRSEVDICNPAHLVRMIAKYRPWAIINAAGYTDVDEAEINSNSCYRGNHLGVENLAIACRAHQIKLMSFSSDLVFDGKKNSPYVETDLTNPLNVYGHSKQLAEASLLTKNPEALVIRTAAFFDAGNKQDFAHHVLNNLIAGNEIMAPDDITVSPTYIPHLVNAALDLLIDDAAGIWHLVNKGCLTWYEFAKKIAEHRNLDMQLIRPVYNKLSTAKRPSLSALESIKYNLMPSLNEALSAYFSNSLFVSQSLISSKNISNERA